jgi:alpha-1,2-mannosyltransferase
VTRRWWLVVAAAVAAGLFLVTVPTFRHFFDLGVYRGAVRFWLVDGGDLYTFRYRDTAYGFTYPPFAGLVLSPLALTSWPVAVAASVVVNAGAVLLLLRWWLPRTEPAVTALLFIAVVIFEPARDTFSFGQVNLVLLALVGLDLRALTRGSRWAGIGIGLATAIKLTPAVFVAYLLVTRRYRAAAVASATTAAATLLAVLVAPDTSRTYWTDAVWDTDRVGRLAYVSNQSLRGVFARLDAGAVWWLVAVAAALACWWWRTRRTRDDPRTGFALTGLLACLISPVTWVHHLVWLLPALFLLLAAGRRAMTGVLWFLLSSSVVWWWWADTSGWVATIGANTYVWITVGLLLALPSSTPRPGVVHRVRPRCRWESLLSRGDFRSLRRAAPVRRHRRAQPRLRL